MITERVGRARAVGTARYGLVRVRELGRPNAIAEAVVHLQVARDLLAAAGAVRAADKVRRAIKSAGGAERHAVGVEARARDALRAVS